MKTALAPFRLAALIALLAGLPLLATAKTLTVKSADEVKQAILTLTPGDTLIFADGTYNLGRVNLTTPATADAPLTLRAEHPGQATLTGKTGFCFEKAAYITLSGFVFATTDFSPVEIRGSHHIRLTRNTLRVTETGAVKKALKWVSIDGARDGKTNSHHNRIDHNLMEGKRTLGQVIAINGLGAPTFQCSQFDCIDHNYFRNIGPRIPNGMETIRTGLSQLSLSSGFTTIESNLFVACDGDPEVVSVKNCDSTVRGNTLIRCQGGVCLRHGNRNTVAGNFFLGSGKRSTDGVRTYGDDHKIYNNYFQDLAGNALEIDSGDRDYPPNADPAIHNDILVRHVRPRRITAAFNTFVHDTHPIALSGKRQPVLPPQDITIANNVVSGCAEAIITTRGPVERLTWLGNIMFPGAQGQLGIATTPGQIRIADPLLKSDGRLWRPAPESPVRGAAYGEFTFVTTDMDGQFRSAPKDAGADQVSTAAIADRPLMYADVGPTAPGE